jgi:hypothetical protein
MSQSSFGEALPRLWPSGDARIAGLGARIIRAAPAVFAKIRHLHAPAHCPRHGANLSRMR